MRTTRTGVGLLIVVLLVGAGCSSHASPKRSTPASTSSRSSSSTARTAEARILVEINGTASTVEAKALAPLATSPSVLVSVIRDLGLSVPVATLAHMISASADTQDGYIDIRTTGAMAVPIANSDARGVIESATHTGSKAHLVLVRPAT